MDLSQACQVQDSFTRRVKNTLVWRHAPTKVFLKNLLFLSYNYFVFVVPRVQQENPSYFV